MDELTHSNQALKDRLDNENYKAINDKLIKIHNEILRRDNNTSRDETVRREV